MTVRIKDLTEVFTLDSTTKLIISDARSSIEEEYKINVFNLLSRNPFKDTAETITEPWLFTQEGGVITIKPTTRDGYLLIKNVTNVDLGRIGREGSTDNISILTEDNTIPVYLGSLAGGDVLKRYGPSGTLYKIWDAGNSNLLNINWSMNTANIAGNIYLTNNNKFLISKDSSLVDHQILGTDTLDTVNVGSPFLDINIRGTNIKINGGIFEVVTAFDTVADMVGTTLEEGKLYRTLGYYEKGGPGGGLYIPSTTAVADSHVHHSVNGGALVAELIFGDILFTSQAGVKHDNATDNLLPGQAAFNAAAGKTLWVDSGRCLTSASFVMPTEGVNLRGTGTIVATPDISVVNNAHTLLSCVGCSNYSIKDVGFDTSTITTFTASTRAIYNFQSSDFEITNTRFNVSGGAVISPNCTNYNVSLNKIQCNSSDGNPHHDGVIDQWWGSTDFTILGNKIVGNSRARYPILVTGTDTAGDPDGCSDFSIIGNRISGATQIGIWLNGRDGINSDFTLGSNVVTDTQGFHGIAIADCDNGTVTGNTVNGVDKVGIRLYSETSGGGATGARNVTVSGNSVFNANRELSTSDDQGSAIVIKDSSNCSLTGNTTKGTTHLHSIFIGVGTSDCSEGRNIDEGATKSPPVQDFSGTTSNRVSYKVFSGATTTNVTNVSSSSIVYRFDADGAMVTCHCKATITTSGAGSSKITATLPITSILTSADDLYGSLADGFGNTASCIGNTTSNEVEITFNAGSANTFILRGSFSYEVK